MRPVTERTEGQAPPTWADLRWHTGETHVRRLQERIDRATTHQAWRSVKNLQNLRVRATSTNRLALRRITQEHQGNPTAGIDGVGYDTPAARWHLLQEGLSLTGYRPRPVKRVCIPQHNGPQSP